MRALRTTLKYAIAELGADHEQVVMLRSLLEAKLREHGASLNNTSTIVSGPVKIVDDQKS